MRQKERVLLMIMLVLLQNAFPLQNGAFVYVVEVAVDVLLFRELHIVQQRVLLYDSEFYELIELFAAFNINSSSNTPRQTREEDHLNILS